MAQDVAPASQPGPWPGAATQQEARASEPAAPARLAPGPGMRGNLAALDLGTNNCRLLIARPEGERFVIVDAFSRIVRLGEGLSATGRLSDAAIERTIAALCVCAEKLRRRRVALARSVATEACRRADNGEEFVARVAAETGIMLDIIPAREEARLAVLGCQTLLEPGEGPAMIFDIGGGSTELVLLEGSGPDVRILDWQSAPWGVVSLTESIGDYEDSDDGRVASYLAMRRRMRDAFAAFAQRLPQAGEMRLLGTSGTVTTLATVFLGLPRYDRQAVDGLIVPAARMREIAGRLATMSVAERRGLPCIGEERADLVVAGCAILESILDIWPAARLGVADRGIREGILRGLLDSARVKTARGRTAQSTRWLERQLNDPYVKRAKAEGYRSRAAYKLIELDEKFALLKGARAILDLGVAPGGWTQVARRLAPQAAVVGIDLLPVDPIDGARLLQLDFMADEAPAQMLDALGAAPDLVLSDMAANTVGHARTDHLRTMGLVEAATDFAIQALRPGGAFVAKVFAGGTDSELLAILKQNFATVKHAKPPASRKGSVEWYVVAQGFKGHGGAQQG
jgi:exopolyphosphatase / guanosine-5'-triphosphate,3'-diphosphate pyrophosphatase